jgi:diguanylate cyclase (GGDEF)-like protein
MSGFFTYYAESNIVCFIIFGIMLVHDLLNVDRQEKQIKYDHALIAFMFYFLSDAVWAGVDSGVFPVTTFTVVATNFSNYVIMAAVMYMWLRFVMAVEQAPHRERPINKFAVLFPFIVSTVALIATYCIAPDVLIDSNLKPQPAFNVFLIGVPYIYIIAVIFYAMRKARHENNPIEKKKHLSIGFFPLIVVIGGLFEMVVMPTLPVFCFSCTILMLIFYIQSMESQISIDPLTGLNNRSQLLRYVSQHSNMHRENQLTYVVMMDVDDFKAVNDTYGHAEGDRALIIIADSLRNVEKDCDYPIFLGRYGGDEFVLIAHPSNEMDIEPLIDSIRAHVEMECKAQQTPYLLSISAGYDMLIDEKDTYQKCMRRADEKLYQNKTFRKAQARTQVAG